MWYKVRLVAVYCCKGAIGKRCGLSPKVVLWIYETMVKAILFYGVFDLWRAPGKTTVAKQLERFQKAAFIGICCAVDTTRAVALSGTQSSR